MPGFDRRIWRVKPPPGTGLARVAIRPDILACPFNEQGGLVIRDYAARRTGAINNTGTATTFERGRHGNVLRFNNVLNAVAFANEDAMFGASLTRVTIMVGSRKTDATLRASGLFGGLLSSDAGRIASHCPFSDGVVYWDFGGTSSGTNRLAVSGLTTSGYNIWTFTAGARGMELWQNGRKVGSHSGTPTVTTDAQPFELGRAVSSTADLVEYDFIYVWRTQLPEAVIQQLSVMPFSVWERYKPVLFGVTPAGGAQTMLPDGIATPAAFDNPTAQQDITILMSSVDSPAAFDDPTLVGSASDIFPVSISTAAAFDDPYIANVDVMEPDGIASPAAFDNPSAFPGPNFIFFSDTVSIYGAAFDAPTLEGGAQTLGLFVGGFNRSDYLLSRTGELDSQTLGRWTASFTALSVPGGDETLVGTSQEWVPRVGQTVILREFGRKLFAGCISERESVPHTGPSANLETRVMAHVFRALDKSSICDHRVVPLITFEADQDAADVVRYVVENYLNGEGIEDTGVPVSMGTLDSEIPVNFWTVTQVFDAIADLTGYQWWVDVNGVLTWSPPASASAAPFDIAVDSANFRGLRSKESLVDYRNKQYVVSNRPVLPGDGTGGSGGPGSLARTEDYTLVSIAGQAQQQEAFNAGLVPGYILVTLPIQQVTQVTITRGMSTIVYPVYVPGSEDPAVAAALDPYWLYFSGPSIVFPWNHTLLVGDVVTVEYVSKAAAAAAIDDGPLVVTTPPSPPPGESFGTCGSGIYEGVFQVNDITTQADLEAYAAGLLARSGVVPLIVEYETDFPGLQVGMRQNADIPRYGLDNVDLFITSIRGRSMGKFDLGHESSFRWQVKAMNTQDLGKWSKWWERLIRRTQHSRPVTVVDAVDFVLAPGTSLAAGTNVTNAAIVKASGRVTEAVIQSDNPAEDQDLVVDLLYEGSSIFPPGGKLRLPDGSTTLQKVITFSQPNIYIFKDRLMRANVTYETTGASPVNARSVTIKLRVEV